MRYYRLDWREREALMEKLRDRVSADGGIVFAYVHGGFLRREFFRDVDVAVWIRDEGEAFQYAVDFSVRLEEELGLPVDVQVLNEAPLPFKFHVFTGGRLIFSRDEELRLRILEGAVKEYLDFKFLTSLIARLA
ncbi:nucleotidyltransferase domain-containing protein [Infirmifilum lucidum]|uniref:Nucleotidyltransferase domain-containing protein n=1 Tax=Infirmifilum lucidum TaxID=2776706 RepID=A0A7L9FHS5_9CREN|nr:nucleotidyltransferase domain-containing protein [Infirmifilum lucidum]QOJ78912.1 nucleotidyltransferase domain-containing protein [Infirmifilum lucidum]